MEFAINRLFFLPLFSPLLQMSIIHSFYTLFFHFLSFTLSIFFFLSISVSMFLTLSTSLSLFPNLSLRNKWLPINLYHFPPPLYHQKLCQCTWNYLYFSLSIPLHYSTVYILYKCTESLWTFSLCFIFIYFYLKKERKSESISSHSDISSYFLLIREGSEVFVYTRQKEEEKENEEWKLTV